MGRLKCSFDLCVDGRDLETNLGLVLKGCRFNRLNRQEEASGCLMSAVPERRYEAVDRNICSM